LSDGKLLGSEPQEAPSEEPDETSEE